MFPRVKNMVNTVLYRATCAVRDGCVKWEHFLNDVAEVADQTGTVQGRIERVEMSLKRGFHMIITVIVSICRRLIGDTSLKCRRLLRSYGNQALRRQSKQHTAQNKLLLVRPKILFLLAHDERYINKSCNVFKTLVPTLFLLKLFHSNPRNL